MMRETVDYSYLVEGLTSDRMTRVTNMSRKYVSYTLPELNNLRREFSPDESKTLSMGELFTLNNTDGGAKLIYTSLYIEDNDIKRALELPTEEDGPEYEWTRDEAFKVLSNGSEDEILDALEFGPHYIAEWWKTDILKVTDINRREFYGTLTGINVNQAAANLEWAAGDKLAQGYDTLTGQKDQRGQRRRRATAEKEEPARQRRAKKN